MSPENKNTLILAKESRERVKRVRRARGMSADDLSAAALISPKTLGKMESSSDGGIPFREATVLKVAKCLDMDLGQLLGNEPRRNIAGCLPDELLEIAEVFAQIDRDLVPVVHDLSVPIWLVAKTYQNLLDQGLQAAGHSREDVVRKLNDEGWRKRVRTTLPSNHLTLEIGRRFESLRFSMPEGSLTVNRPQLLWDCHDDTPCERPQKFRCPVHGHPLGTRVRSRFTEEPLLIKHDGLEFLWRYGPELFPPSVDSFHMLEALEGEDVLRQPLGTCLDLGAGTGFLGICLARRNGRIATVVLRDWLLTPVLFSAVNAERNRPACPSTRFSVELAYHGPPRSLTERRYDLVVCNPPYLPLLRDFESLGWLSAVAGTDLLEFAIENARTMGRQVYVQFSNLALPEAQIASERSGNALCPIGKPRRTPFRVQIAWEKEGYLDALKQRGLETRLKERHPYWHTIQTYRVE